MMRGGVPPVLGCSGRPAAKRGLRQAVVHAAPDPLTSSAAGAWLHGVTLPLGYSPRPLTMQVMLRIPLQLPGGPVRFEFAVFGGSFMDPALRADIAKCGPTTCDRESGEQRPCSDYAVRIGLTVHPDGRCAACWVAAPAAMHMWQRRARGKPPPPRGGQKPGQVTSALSADGAPIISCIAAHTPRQARV